MTGEHTQFLEILKVMSTFAPADMLLVLAGSIVNRVSKSFYRDISNRELEINLTFSNLLAAMKKPELLDKALKKEEKNHVSLGFDRDIITFTPGIDINTNMSPPV